MVLSLGFSSLTFSPNISRLTLATDESSTTVEENIDTTEAEIAYSLQFLEHLPAHGELGFENFTKLPDQSKFKEDRKDTIRHKDGSTEVIVINEKAIYAQIEVVVKELIEKVESRTPSEGMTSEEIKADAKYSSHYELSKEMRITKAIYRWVANNISYDFESIEKDYNGLKSFRKPQDALFVFSQRMGVCSGYTTLTNLMMKIACIPCTYLASINGRNTDYGHAFNAIYINNKTNNRLGWTLIDSTWASPNSDRHIEDTRAKNMIESTCSFYNNIFERILYRQDGYTQELKEKLSITYEDQRKLDDSEIKELNQKATDLLNTLNKKHKGRKFESIEFLRGKYGLDVKYKTNISLEEAKKITEKNDEVLNKRFIDGYIHENYNFLICNTFENLNVKEKDLDYFFLNQLNKINSLKNSKLKERSKEYTRKIKEICTRAIINNSNSIENNIGKINNEIKTNLDILNTEYQDIIIFNQIKINAPELNQMTTVVGDFNQLSKTGGDFSKLIKTEALYQLTIDVTTSVDEEEAKSLHKKQTAAQKAKAKIVMYFPAFYRSYMSLEEANKFIISRPFHKLNFYESLELIYGFEINGVNYALKGNETKAYIKITGDLENPAENVVIPEDLLNLGIKFSIGNGIKSLILTANEIINIESDSELQYIDTSNSSRYTLDDVFLYEKTNSAEKGKLVSIIRSSGKIEDISYTYGFYNNNLNFIYIFVEKETPLQNVKIPEELSHFKVPVRIAGGIKSLILTGDEIIDIFDAYELESIDATNSNRYIVEDNILYEKTESGEKGAKISKIEEYR